MILKLENEDTIYVENWWRDGQEVYILLKSAYKNESNEHELSAEEAIELGTNLLMAARQTKQLQALHDDTQAKE